VNSEPLVEELRRIVIRPKSKRGPDFQDARLAIFIPSEAAAVYVDKHGVVSAGQHQWQLTSDEMKSLRSFMGRLLSEEEKSQQTTVYCKSKDQIFPSRRLEP
jgi:hypothetical protein